MWDRSQSVSLMRTVPHRLNMGGTGTDMFKQAPYSLDGLVEPQTHIAKFVLTTSC